MTNQDTAVTIWTVEAPSSTIQKHLLLL